VHRTKYPWIATALVLATVPLACMINVPDSGAGGSGGSAVGGGFGGGSGGGDQCNPVTSDGCTSAGSACDLAPSGYFTCFPPPVAAAVGACGACDNDTLYCAATLTCVFPDGMGDDGACFRYCCTDGDCGAGATCDVSFGASVLPTMNRRDAVGLCVTGAGSSAACGPPATSPAPSGGACVGGYPGDAGAARGDGGG
jgi:hypothetical protein